MTLSVRDVFYASVFSVIPIQSRILKRFPSIAILPHWLLVEFLAVFANGSDFCAQCLIMKEKCFRKKRSSFSARLNCSKKRASLPMQESSASQKLFIRTTFGAIGELFRFARLNKLECLQNSEKFRAAPKDEYAKPWAPPLTDQGANSSVMYHCHYFSIYQCVYPFGLV